MMILAWSSGGPAVPSPELRKLTVSPSPVDVTTGAGPRPDSATISHGGFSTAEVAVDLLVLPHHPLDAKGSRTATALLTKGQGPLAILQGARERHREGVRISWRHKQTRPPIDNHLRDATSPSGNDRFAQAHGLEGRETERLSQAREHHYRAERDQRGDVVSLADEPDHAIEAAAPCLRLKPLSFRPITGQEHEKRAHVRQNSGQGVEENAVPLLLMQARHHEAHRLILEAKLVPQRLDRIGRRRRKWIRTVEYGHYLVRRHLLHGRHDRPGGFGHCDGPVRMAPAPRIDPRVPALAQPQIVVGVMSREDEARAGDPRSQEPNEGGIETVRVEHRNPLSSEQPSEPCDGPTILPPAGHAQSEGGGSERRHVPLERTLGSQRSDHHRESDLVVMTGYCPEVGWIN